jgi:uncharacterized 2Fe-2S/4Fe-4S cluster protein (DUF4445 family)
MTDPDAAPAKGWVERVTLTPPSLEDNSGDADRLARALKRRLGTDAVRIELPLMRRLPALLRESDWSLRCILFKEPGGWVVTRALPADDPRPAAGLAVDLGTTRVVMRLLDLETGVLLGERSFDNPQLSVGPDILTRIHFADTEGGLEHLNRLIIDGFNKEIDSLCGEAAVASDEVCLLSVAGNTAMTHLFLGLHPHWMVREPYIPAVNVPGTVIARNLGLAVAPSARVFVFPNIGAYFGGDLLAGILYAGLHRSSETALLVDVGTNAEVVLGNENWLIACAGAAGPALEGGVSKIGAMAGPGIIDRVAIDPESRDFHIHTIDDQPARGICGSGFIDLAAQLFLRGMLDIRGKLVPEACGDLYKERDGTPRLVIAPAAESATGEDLTIDQADIDSLIRSKAAMYTILETLTGTVGIDFSDIATFNVAGTFGVFIDPASAIAIGMIPDIPTDRFNPLGNSSLGGAAMVLTSRKALEAVYEIREGITYLELNVNQDFMNRFSAAKFLPHTDRSRFPSVVRG